MSGAQRTNSALTLAHLGGGPGASCSEAAQQLAGLEAGLWLISKAVFAWLGSCVSLPPLGLIMRVCTISI